MFGVDGTCGDLRKLLLPMARPTRNGCWHVDPKASLSTHSRRGEIGPDLFRAACQMVFRGIGVQASRRSISVGSVKALD